MPSFKIERERDIEERKDEFDSSLKDYISNYTDYYNDDNGISRDDIIQKNNELNDKFVALQRNNDMMYQGLQEPTVDSEDWKEKWNEFKEHRGSANSELYELQKDLKHKVALVSQTQRSYNHEYNKFIVYSIFNVLFGLGAGYVTINLFKNE